MRLTSKKEREIFSEDYKTEDDLKEFDELNDMKKDELEKKARSEYNLSDEEWERKTTSEPIYSKKVEDKIAHIEYFVEQFENNLRGRTLHTIGSEGGDKESMRYVQTGKAVADDKLIRRIVGVLKTFANPTMLISKVREQDFNMQFEDAFYKLSDDLVQPHTYLDVEHQRNILKQFKDTFWNIGAIFEETKGNMKEYFGNLKKAYEDADTRVTSRLGD